MTKRDTDKISNIFVKYCTEFYDAGKTRNNCNKDEAIGIFNKVIARLRGACVSMRRHDCRGRAGIVKLES